MSQATNGVPATQLRGATWKKSRHSVPDGNCVELAELTDGQIAVRNSRHPNGPALIYTHAQIAAFLQDAKEGKLDGQSLG